jgi:GTPase-activator protein for Ras-like GTPase/Concanavalin A-like lectin/glucanases superfamily/Bacterial cadherin-like domain/Bacterial Ig domain
MRPRNRPTSSCAVAAALLLVLIAGAQVHVNAETFCTTTLADFTDTVYCSGTQLVTGVDVYDEAVTSTTTSCSDNTFGSVTCAGIPDCNLDASCTVGRATMTCGSYNGATARKLTWVVTCSEQSAPQYDSPHGHWLKLEAGQFIQSVGISGGDLGASASISMWIGVDSTAWNAPAALAGLANGAFGVALDEDQVIEFHVGGTVWNTGFRLHHPQVAEIGPQLYHLVLSSDSTTGLRLYVNGKLQAHNTVAVSVTPLTTSPLLIAEKWTGIVGDEFNGYFDEVALWPGAIVTEANAQSVRDTAVRQCALTTCASVGGISPVLAFTFDNTSDHTIQMVTDQSGQANDGSLNFEPATYSGATYEQSFVDPLFLDFDDGLAANDGDLATLPGSDLDGPAPSRVIRSLPAYYDALAELSDGLSAAGTTITSVGYTLATSGGDNAFYSWKTAHSGPNGSPAAADCPVDWVQWRLEDATGFATGDLNFFVSSASAGTARPYGTSFTVAGVAEETPAHPIQLLPVDPDFTYALQLGAPDSSSSGSFFLADDVNFGRGGTSALMAIEFWFSPGRDFADALAQDVTIFAACNNGANLLNLRVGNGGDQGKFKTSINGDDAESSVLSLHAGHWHHVKMTLNADLLVEVDGVTVITDSGSGDTSSATLNDFRFGELCSGSTVPRGFRIHSFLVHDNVPSTSALKHNVLGVDEGNYDVIMDLNDGEGLPTCRKCPSAPSMSLTGSTEWRRRNEPECDVRTLEVFVSSLPSEGTLWQTSDGMTRGNEIELNDVVMHPEYRVIYSLDTPDYIAGDSFQYRARDEIAAGTTAGTVTLDMVDANDPPTANDGLGSIDEDIEGPLVITGSDPEGNPLEAIVSRLPERGTLQYNNFDVVADTTVISLPVTNQLTFLNVLNENGDAYATFEFYVRDNGSPQLSSGTALFVIDVNPQQDAPVAFNTNATLEEGGFVEIPLTATDVDGQSLTLNVGTGPTLGNLYTDDTFGTELTSGNPIPGTSVFYRPCLAGNGCGALFGDPYESFTFTAHDGIEASPVATVFIVVTPFNDPPVATYLGPMNTTEDTPVLATLTGTDVDNVDATLEFRIFATPTRGELVAPEGPDRLLTSGSIVGAASLYAVEYRPFEDESCFDLPCAAPFDSFSYQAYDGSKFSAKQDIDIYVQPVPDPPKSRDQAVTVKEDTEVAITLYAVDPDPQVVVLTVVIVRAPPTGETLTFETAGGAPLADGSPLPPGEIIVRYQAPLHEFNRTHQYTSFVYKVRDQNGRESENATVTIRVTAVNDAPTSVDVGPLLGVEDEWLLINLTSSVADADYEDTLRVRVDLPTVPGAKLSLVDSTIIPNSNFRVSPNAQGDLLVRYRGAPDGNGVPSYDTFTYRAEDTGLPVLTSPSSIVSIGLTAVNDPPVVAPSFSVSLPEDVGGTINLFGRATDIDSVEALLVYNVSVSREGVTLGAFNGSLFFYVPSTLPDAVGVNADSFTFSARDPEGAYSTTTSTVTINLTPEPDAPTANGVAFPGVEATQLTVTLDGSDPDAGETATLRGIIVSLPNPLHGFLYTDAAVTNVIVPGDLPLLLADMLVYFVGVRDFPACPVGPNNCSLPTTFAFAVQDITARRSLSNATATLTITATNEPPRAINDIVVVSEDAVEAPFTLAGVDDDSLVVSATVYAFTGAGTLFQVNLDTTLTDITATVQGGTPVQLPSFQLAYTAPPGQSGELATVVFRVKDDQGAESTAGSVSLRVSTVDDPPEASVFVVGTTEDVPLRILLVGTDDNTAPDDLMPIITTLPAPGTGSLQQLDGTPISAGDPVTWLRYVVYVPPAHANGADLATFNYTMFDGNLTSVEPGMVTVSVAPANDAPFALDLVLNVTEDSAPTDFRLRGFDIDGTENSTLRFSLLYWPPGSTVEEAGGQLSTQAAPGVAFSLSDPLGIEVSPLLRFQPAPDVHSSPMSEPHWVLKYVANDTRGIVSDVARVRIFVVPQQDDPVAAPVAIATLEDTAVPIVLSCSDIDGAADEAALVYEVLTTPTRGAIYRTVDGVARSSHCASPPCTLTAPPYLASVLVYEPPLNSSGVYTFDYRCAGIGPTGQSAAVTVTITVAAVDDPPVALGVNVRVPEGPTVVLNFTGVDIDTSSATLTARISVLPYNDRSLDPGFLSQNVAPFDRINATDTPVLSISDGVWSVIYQPPVVDASNQDVPRCLFRFVLCDGTSCSNEALVRVFVEGENDPPVVADQWVTMYEDRDNLFAPTAIDDSGNVLTFTLVRLPERGDLYQNFLGTFRGPAILTNGTVILNKLIYVAKEPEPGHYTDTFAYQASDGFLLSPVAVVNVTMVPVNDPPQAFSRTLPVVPTRDLVFSLRDPLFSFDAENQTLAYYITSAMQRGELRDGATVITNATSFPYLVQSGNAELTFNSLPLPPGGSTFSPFATFSWYAFDGLNVSNVAAMSIDLVANRAPSAVNANATLDEDSCIVLVLPGVDQENDPLSAEVMSPPLRGTLFQYRPSGGSAGPPDDVVCSGSGAAGHFGSVIGVADTCGEFETCIFEPTQVTDSQRRVIFSPGTDASSGVDVNNNLLPFTLFSFRVADDDTNSAIAIFSLTVRPLEDSPVALNVTVTVREEDEKAVALEGIDAEDDLLTYVLLTVPNSPLYQTLDGRDPVPIDSDTRLPVPIAIPADEPRFVEVTNENQQVLYAAPRVDSVVAIIDQFSYKLLVFPGGNTSLPYTQESNVAFVTITTVPVNDQPRAFDLRYRVLEDGNVTITLLGSDRDVADEGQLFPIIASLPRDGALFQYSDDGSEPDRIVTPFTDVTDVTNLPQWRVVYAPAADGAGDDYARFEYYITDGKVDSLYAEVIIDVTPENDAPSTAGVPPPLLWFAGSDKLIELGGFDVDEGDMEKLRAIIIDPFSESMQISGSQLYEAVPSRVLRDHLNWTATVTRGPAIVENNTLLADPERRVIMACESENAQRSTVSFEVRFTDGQLLSEPATITVLVPRPDSSLPDGYEDTTPFVIAVLVGIVATIFFLFLAALLVWRRNKTRTHEDTFRDLPFMNDPSDEDIVPDAEVDGDEKGFAKPRGPLERLILDSKFQVVSALLQAIDIAEYDAIAKAMVAVFEYHEITLDMLKYFITLEVENASSAGTLFRANSIASKMMTAYSKMIGQEYLVLTLRPPIENIIKREASMEVDPRKLKGGDSRKANMKLLLLACQNFVDWIVTSTGNAPIQFRILSHHLFFEVGKRFPGSKHTAVGGFLFLRFFCPAIISPEGFKIVQQPPPHVARRALVLIAKALQNLANQVTFGKKEEYMIDVNQFIEANAENIQTFFDSMVRLPPKLGTVPNKEVSPEILEKSLTTLQEVLAESQERIVAILEGRDGDDSEKSSTRSTRSRRSRDTHTDDGTGSLSAAALGDTSGTSHTDVSDDDSDMEDAFGAAAASSSTAAAAALAPAELEQQVFIGEDGEEYVLAGAELSDDDEVLYDDDVDDDAFSLEVVGTETARDLNVEYDEWTNVEDLDLSDADWELEADAPADAPRDGFAADGTVVDPVLALRSVLRDLA